MSEFRERFEKLTDNDLRRLFSAARHFTWNAGPAVANLEPDEILNETWVRFALDGRVLGQNDDLIRKFIGGMRSVAYNLAKKGHMGDLELKDGSDYPASGQTPEESAIDSDRQERARRVVNAVFGKDLDARSVYLMSSDGYSRSEIQKKLGISCEQREAARKRAERLLKGLLAGRVSAQRLTPKTSPQVKNPTHLRGEA